MKLYLIIFVFHYFLGNFKTYFNNPTLENDQETEYSFSVEKRHKCSVCSYSTNKSSNLQSHMKIHTGEKPYACKFCQKTFRMKHHLKSHFLVHTNKKFV